MKIEAVIVCDGYADFLAETLPRNLPLFDRALVVTGFDDAATIRLCHDLSVQCVETDVHKQGFAKGRAIDLGLSFCRRDDWVLHLDADLYLPPMARHWIEIARPDPACIYGCDRADCIGWETWQEFIQGHPKWRTGHQYHNLVSHPAIDDYKLPLGHRLALADHGGYVPIGFFQLFHGSHNRRYPRVQSDGAEHTDVLFSLQWPTHNRRLLPEIIAVHLMSEDAGLGANWKGRTTRHFGPPARPASPADGEPQSPSGGKR